MVPLSRAALAVLKVRKKALFGDKTPTGYVLPSRTGRELDNRTGNWARFTGQISEKAAVQGWHRHDLHRTAAALMAEMKVDHMVIELLLNHSERQAKGGLMTEMNNRRSYAMEMRQAIEGLADRIDRIAAGAEAEIAQLRAGWRPPGAAWHWRLSALCWPPVSRGMTMSPMFETSVADMSPRLDRCWSPRPCPSTRLGICRAQRWS